MTRTLRARALAVVAGTVFWLTGCVTSPLRQAAYDYYLEGPEAALEVLSSAEIDLRDAVLVDLEKGMAMLELGRYRPALELFDRVAARLDETGDPWRVRAANGAYLGEHHEQVLVRTLATLAALALQDVPGAAERAARTLAAIDAGGCGTCGFGFSRTVAAAALEAAGRRAEAAAALEPVAVEGGYLEAELRRLRYEVDPGEGLAPPPGEPVRPPRTLVTFLLLGAGPAKTFGSVDSDHGTWPWPQYVPSWSSVARDAILLTGDGRRVHDEALVDIGRLAWLSLRARLDRELGTAKEVATGSEGSSASDGATPAPGASARRTTQFTGDTDLRCWLSLPSLGAVIRAELAPEVEECELVLVSWSGEAVSRERLEVPVEWQEGQLFVVRRSP